MSDGSVRVEMAYAQGKMLDHSAWNGILPRGITPSDIDSVFDNNGWLLFCEIKFGEVDASWDGVSTGQRRLAESLVLNSQRQAAVLCFHHVDTARLIDTVKDVHSFSPMWAPGGKVETYGPFHGNRWERFVLSFYENPRSCLELFANPYSQPTTRTGCLRSGFTAGCSG